MSSQPLLWRFANYRWEWPRVRSLHIWWASSRANLWSSTEEEHHAQAGSRRPAPPVSSTSDRALPVLPGLWRWAVCTCASWRHIADVSHVILGLFPQVEASASKLNTNDVFVLKTPKTLFVWKGVGASDEEIQAAKHVVGFLGGSPTNVSEGKEPGGCPLLSQPRIIPNTERSLRMAFA